MGSIWASCSSVTMTGIYMIRNTMSGRQYVGSALNIHQRWHSHRSLLSKGKHHSVTLQRSWIKHSPEAFLFEILEQVEDANQLVPREQFWIDKLNSACPRTGFNISPTAGSPLGVKHSFETRAKMSAIRKGVKFGPQSDAHKAALRKSRLGTKHSLATRCKMSAARKGVPKPPFSEDHKAAMSLARLRYESDTGRTAIRNKSDHMREMVRASKIKRYSTPEGIEELRSMAIKRWAIKRLSGEPLGRPMSDETKLKLSIAEKGKMTDQHKAAIAASNRRRSTSNHAFGPPIHN